MENSLKVPVDRLKLHCNPLDGCDVWCVGESVTSEMVDAAFVSGRLNPNPNETGRLLTAQDHAARIAYLAHYGWDDAISVDVGIPSLCCHVDWMVEDGNHRLAAAIYRGDETILAGVSGCNEYMLEIFGVNYA